MKQSVTVRVPATSANLGPGFDALGLALSLYHTLTLSEAEKTEVYIRHRLTGETEKNNLILKAARAVYTAVGAEQPKGFLLIQNSHIPSARGLGSSAACVVGGLLAANRLLGDPLTKDELLQLGCELEGHPDNLLPAMYGGFCASACRAGQVLSARCEIKKKLKFVALVPDARLRTGESRAALPAEVSRETCAFQIGGASLVTAAFFSGNYRLLSEVTEDRLCTPVRLPLIEGGEELLALGKACGALTGFISGAGSSILLLFDKECDGPQKLLTMAKNKEMPVPVRVYLLRGDNRGAIYLENDQAQKDFA